MPTIMFKKNSHSGVFEINEQHDDILNTIEVEPATTIERHLEMIMPHLRVIREDIVKLNENSEKLENVIGLMQREFAGYKDRAEEKLDRLINEKQQ